MLNYHDLFFKFVNLFLYVQRYSGVHTDLCAWFLLQQWSAEDRDGYPHQATPSSTTTHHSATIYLRLVGGGGASGGGGVFGWQTPPISLDTPIVFPDMSLDLLVLLSLVFHALTPLTSF